MAAWQYDLFLIGRESSLPLLTDMGWEVPGPDAESTLGAQEALVSAFGFPWLMMDDWVVFGNEQGTRVDFIFDDQDGVEIRIRIDASALDPKLDAICTFAHELRGRLFDPAAHKIITPDRSSLVSALAASHAWAFCRDSQSFLDDIKKQRPAR